MLVKEIKSGNKTVQIFQYSNSDYNPRNEFENLGTMISFHRRYELGDSNHGFKQEDYNSWEGLRKAMEKMGYVVILPIYLYDHSGLSLSTSPFSCPWDSGQVGFIGVTREKLLKNFQVNKVTKQIHEKAAAILEGEVQTQNDYLSGEIYGYKTFEDGEEVDSCWGFFGDNFSENGLFDYAGIKEE